MIWRHRPRTAFWSAVVGSIAVALAAYYAFAASLPDCGPSQNSTLGEIYWFVPLAILMGQSRAVALSGAKTARSRGVIVSIALLAAVVTVIGGVAIWIHFFIAGNCGE